MTTTRPPMLRAIAEALAAPNPTSGYDPLRYPVTALGAWRYLREVAAPAYLATAASTSTCAVMRRARRWAITSWIAAAVLLLGVWADAMFLAAFAAGTLLLAIGERGECLGFIRGRAETHQLLKRTRPGETR